MAQLNTRLVLRNDSSANWSLNSSVILLKGEVGIEYLTDGLVKMKIGDGVKTWAELDYFGDTHLITELQTQLETLEKTVETQTATIETIETRIEEVAADAYTKDETDEKIAAAVAAAEHLKRKTVVSADSIDLEADDAEQYIYMVPNDEGTYDEYMVLDGELEKVGNWKVDLSEYAKTADINAALDLKANTADVTSALDLKADKTELANLAVKSDVDAALALKANNEVVDALAQTVTAKADKTYVDEELAKKANSEDVTNALANKADKADTLAGYGITDAYTKNEVDTLIGAPAVYGEEDEEGNAEVVTPATGIYANIYTRTEIADLIADITGGESAADVKALLEAYKGTNDARVKNAEDRIAALEEIGADDNVIEAIKVNGVALEIIDKAVDVSAATAEKYGVVKLSTEINANAETGALEVVSLNANKLVQSTGEYLILNGGSASTNI